jgi:hypothetical protein
MIAAGLPPVTKRQRFGRLGPAPAVGLSQLLASDSAAMIHTCAWKIWTIR